MHFEANLVIDQSFMTRVHGTAKNTFVAAKLSLFPPVLADLKS